MEAVILGRRSRPPWRRSATGLAADYLARIQDCLETPWATAVSDLVYPLTRDERPPDFDKRMQYGMALTRLVAEDADVHRTLGEVTHLLRPQSTLCEPELANRVMALMATA